MQAVILDDTLVWEPNQKLRRIVDIGSMTAACIDMLQYISLRAVWWDMWNSGTGVHDLRAKGIMCDRHNLNGSDYDFFKSIIYTNRFIAPECPEVRKGIGQVKHLSRTNTNNVTTGSSLHKKDISDTWCGITALLLGSLVKINLRMGRAPSSITIASGKSAQGITSSGVAQGSSGNQNPFSEAMGGAGRQLISNRPVTDHSDMFRGLNPGVGGRSRNIGGGSARKVKPTVPTRSRFPRGTRL